MTTKRARADIRRVFTWVAVGMLGSMIGHGSMGVPIPLSSWIILVVDLWLWLIAIILELLKQPWEGRVK